MIFIGNEIDNTLNQLMKKEWVVYAKAAIDHPESVVRYLSRYTRKIAISESRLIAMDDEMVTFQYRDYRDNQGKQQTLQGIEFVRRYLSHIFPLGFMRIRHYGWLSNANSKKQLAIVRKAIRDYHAKNSLTAKKIKYSLLDLKKQFEGIHCPNCKKT